MGDQNGKCSSAGFDNDFITEIKDDLDLLEPDLLAMEKEGSRVGADLINHAFRAIHSIKGGAGFCGLRDLGAISHSMENVLMRIRDGRLDITSEIVDALLAGLDRMKLMISNLGTGTPVEFLREKQILDGIVVEGASPVRQPSFSDLPEQSGTGKTKPPVSPPGTICPDSASLDSAGNLSFRGRSFKVEQEQLERAAREGKFVYVLVIEAKKDIAAKGRNVRALHDDLVSTGEILYADPDLSDMGSGDAAAGDSFFAIVLATILDTEFLAEVIEILPEQILRLDPPPLGKVVASPLSPPLDARPGPIDSVASQASEREAIPVPVREDSTSKPPRDTGEEAHRPEIKKPGETIRVSVDLISRLMNLAGELVLGRNQLKPLIEGYAREDTGVNSVMQNLNLVTTEIQEDIMQLRMQPVSILLGRFNRMVRDMARILSKEVELVVQGGEVELDRTVLEGLANPFTHLIRNCVDHGIETPQERKALGKPGTGTITIRAFHQSGHVHIIIEDDGRGMAPDRIVRAALDKGIISAAKADGMTDKEKIGLIFLPGFSTADVVTDISGRGVGMDVVKTNIEQLRGVIDIESEPGKGTRVQIIIPLTLAIVSALILGTGQFRFAIPQINVSEVVFLKPGDLQNSVESINRSDVMRFRGSLLPVVRLRTLLGMETLFEDSASGAIKTERRHTIADRRNSKAEPEGQDLRARKNDRRKTDWGAVYVVVLKVGNNRFGLCVEDLYDMEEIVVKPLSHFVRDCRCFSGATILGDGKVIMILDAVGMAAFAGLRFDAVNAEAERRKAREMEARATEVQARNVIIFSSARDEFFALPLSRIARLESIRIGDIHRIGSKRFMKYNDSTLSLVKLEDMLPVSPCVMDDPELHVIIPKGISMQSGLVVHKIIDTMEIARALTRDATSPEGVEGKAFIDGRLVQFLDLDRLAVLMQNQLTVTT
ncbi:MAG: chemotaxis protein CheA [Pseudomonadota bacterium]